MSVYCYDCLELRNDCFLVDMSPSARNRSIIAMSVYCYQCLGLRSNDCFVCVMVCEGPSVDH